MHYLPHIPALHSAQIIWFDRSELPGTKDLETYLIENTKIISKTQVLEFYCTG